MQPACQGEKSYKNFVEGDLIRGGLSTVKNYGEMQFGPFLFGKDVSATLLLSFGFNNGNLPKDWSIVAWGEKGPIHVHSLAGEQSDKWPYEGGLKSFGVDKPEVFKK
mmetsp:Transcript_32243/g.42702  ORF Transcript_32243/g.42702 Transcript_32243/m.42702 type:complete len:107 (-) Transcript_32243:484-804(-)